MSTRRELLQAGLGTAAAAALHGAHAAPSTPASLLILGGTGFIGPHLTTEAQRLGWKVTHFNRGKSAPGGVNGVETLIGDRNGQLDALRGRRWDVVIDDTGYVPKYVKESAQLLAPETGFYLFISSISAYASFAHPNDEHSPTGKLANPDLTDMSGATYGPMKALCEQYTLAAFKDRACVVRPGYIVGPLDNTDRFTYWPVRASKGGEMLAPGTPQDPIQIIDVRDLCAFMMQLVGRRTPGTYNAVSPPGGFSMGQLIKASLDASPAAGTRVTWVTESFLKDHWNPDEDLGFTFTPWAPLHGEMAGLSQTSAARALKAGLRSRPLAETVRDTLKWFQSLPAQRQSKLLAGPDAAKEATALQQWHAAGPKA